VPLLGGPALVLVLGAAFTAVVFQFGGRRGMMVLIYLSVFCCVVGDGGSFFDTYSY
jgi:hypothetical protein